jgi:putative FmdB family regulatory protein
MPAYDFKCTACGAVFEITRRAGEATPVTCPACGAPAKRVFTPVGVHFKGPGFHNTDYRKASDKRPADAPAGPAPTPSCPASDGGTPCPGCPATE